MDWLNPLSLILGSTGFVYWALASYLRVRPPKKINQLYGYRTKRSMVSQEAWDFAQVYSANLMHRSGLILMAVAGVRIFFSSHSEIFDVIISVLIVIASCVHLMMETERALKSRFEL